MNAQEKKPSTESGTRERLIDVIKECECLEREIAEILNQERTEEGVPKIRLVGALTEGEILKMDFTFETLRKLLAGDYISDDMNMLAEVQKCIRALDRVFCELSDYVQDEIMRSAYYDVPMLPFVQKIKEPLLGCMASKLVEIDQAWHAFAYGRRTSLVIGAGSDRYGDGRGQSVD